jgi:FkbM family methyltransferase
VANLGTWNRFDHLRRTMKNWPMVVPDKLGLVHMIRYCTRSGLVVWCRGRSTDVNEAVVVLAGLEYPYPYGMLTDGAFVIDAGANIGSFVLLLRRLNRTVNFSGVAIEPSAETLELLRRNLTVNGVQGFKIVHGVVSDVDGVARIRTDVDADAIHISNTGVGVQVPALRLSSYCKQHNIDRVDLLKMDIEGAEYRVIESDYDFLREYVVRALIEYHESDSFEGLAWIIDRMGADFAIEVVDSRPASGVIHVRNERLMRQA